ncbi:MAG: Lrp/AsnC ligand binding domain-containing protein [Actinomycetota bacterium]
MEAAVQSYVLVTTHGGQAGHVAKAARAFPHVSDAEVMLGSQYDVVMEIKTESYADLGDLVDRIHRLPGVEQVSTCEGHPGPGVQVQPAPKVEIVLAGGPRRSEGNGHVRRVADREHRHQEPRRARVSSGSR